MIFVSTTHGTFEFQSVDDAIKFVQTAAKKKDTLWVHTGDELYPCLAVCTNEQYAAINFFKMIWGILGSLITKIIKRKSLFLRKV